MRTWCPTVVLLMFLSPALAQTAGDRFTHIASFALGSTTFQKISQSLGPVQVVRTGDAGESLASMCYSIPGGYVTFLAGELDGPEHYLGGVHVSRRASRGPCAKWERGPAISFLRIGGLNVGMSRSQFQSEVRAPLSRKGSTVEASFEGKRKINDIDFDVVITVTANVRAGRVSEIEVWKTETN